MIIYPPKINPEKEEKKITTFIKQTFTLNNKSKALVAVSGGVDSTASLFLTVKALGPKNVYALLLPSRLTDPIHLKQAQLAIKQIGLPPENYTTINIGSIIQKTWRIIKHYSTLARSENQKLNPLRLANLSARIRMILIYDHAKLLDALVIGTENLSEHLLGYYTRYGDEASDLEPIRHLYKTQVYDLARFLHMPPEILSKPPTADLWPSQSDEKELGFSYQAADPILYLKEQGKTEKEIISLGVEEKLVKMVFTQVKKMDFKHHVPYTISL